MKTKTLSVRLDPETEKDLSLLAADQHLSLEEFIVQQLQEWIQDRQKAPKNKPFQHHKELVSC